MEKKFKGSLKLDWINKDKSLYYEIDEAESRGIKPVWVDKNDIRVSEPRILNFVKNMGDENNENILIRGDNLLALRTLIEQFKGKKEKDKVKCVYIDPPFNTGSAFERYDDNLQRSEWLTMMRDRLLLLKQLLRKDGVIYVHLDQCEVAYLKVLMDEIFGMENYLNTITINATAPFGFKHTAGSIFSSSNYILSYAKDKSKATLTKIYVERQYDPMYEWILLNPSENYKEWRWRKVEEVAINEAGYKSTKEAIKDLGKDEYAEFITSFVIKNAARVFRIAAVTGGALAKREATIEKSKQNKDKVYRHPNDDMDYYFLNGGRMLFYDKRLVKIGNSLVPGEVITDIWMDISWMGIAKEGGVDFPKGKKPEKLIKRLIEMCTEYNDLVLDSFAGSGTTGAVAHKMGRRWIMVEMGRHAEDLCLTRLKRVVDGSDQSGISKEVEWKGCGGFKYYKLGESLISGKDMNWNLTYKQMAEALFYTKNFELVETPEMEKKNVYIGKNRHQRGVFAACSVSKDMESIKADDYFTLIKLLADQGMTELNIYTNKAINVRKLDQLENVFIRKIPQTILRKYGLI